MIGLILMSASKSIQESDVTCGTTTLGLNLSKLGATNGIPSSGNGFVNKFYI